MPRTLSIVIACLSLLAVTEPASGQMLAWEEPSPQQQRIREALETVTHVEFDDVPLEEAIQRLSTVHRIPMLLDYKALEDGGIGSDSPISFSQTQLSLRTMLHFLLDAHDLTWTIMDNVLVITTKDDADSKLSTKIYDVRKIVPRARRNRDRDPSAYDYDFYQLIELIRTTIEPDSWSDNGGPGAIEYLEGPNITAFTISQTHQLHEQIESLLVNLHELGGHSVPRYSRSARITQRVGALDSNAMNAPVRTSQVWNPRNLPMTRLRGKSLETPSSRLFKTSSVRNPIVHE